MMRCLLFFVLISSLVKGQYDPLARNAFLHQDVDLAFDYWNITRPNQTFHSAFKPYLSSTYSDATDSLVPFHFSAFKNFILSKTFNEKPEKRNWYNVQILPIVDAGIGFDPLLKKALPEYLGGLHLKLNINDDFTFAGTAFGGRASLPFFLDSTVAKQHLMPDYGLVYGNNNSGYTIFDYRGYVSYSPKKSKVFNLQAGRDKHFIGDGYRSVLLSDFGPAYPFLRINTNLWHFQYNVWYTWMYDIRNSNGSKNQFTNKFATFHYLSYNILKELNVGLFENIVWRGTDSNQVRTYEVNYLNPIIFFRPQEYSVGSPDNAFIGINLNAKLFKCLKLYGQLGLDEFYLSEIRKRRGWWANKQAWQLGLQYINALEIKGLSMRAEYNEVRPYTYTHGVVEQNYAHYGTALAHPFGANFRELIGQVKLRRDKWQISMQGMAVFVGKDTLGSKSNMGQNIFLSYTTRPYEFGHKTTQGVKTDILQSDIKFTWFVVPDMNLRVELGYIQRSEKNTEGYELQNPFFYFGIKTSFWNSYKDY